MLKVNKSRRIVANFFVGQGNDETLVKSTVIEIDNQAVSNISEQLVDSELYAANRKEMRKDEQKLRDLRYSIEDEILSELEADEQTAVAEGK